MGTHVIQYVDCVDPDQPTLRLFNTESFFNDEGCSKSLIPTPIVQRERLFKEFNSYSTCVERGCAKRLIPTPVV